MFSLYDGSKSTNLPSKSRNPDPQLVQNCRSGLVGVLYGLSRMN
ncbi:hypothetical protein CORAM0001_1997 [Corynebacterium amycolatum SK46]|nr:hypothetical protein CORAM0001_1997 [Corynebacterium amycolatum SK46]